MKIKRFLPLIFAFALCSCDEKPVLNDQANEQSSSEQEQQDEITLSIKNKENFELEVESTKQLEAELKGATGTLLWTSSATEVATVDETGEVKGVSAGSSTITVSYGEYSDSVEVSVKEKEIQYAVWPEEDMKIVVMGINKTATETIPSYDKAMEITIDWQLFQNEGYFGIYCATEDPESVNEYIETLTLRGWDIDSKVEEDGFYNAFSPRGQLWLNFGYVSETKQLEIYATEGMFIHWPSSIVDEYLHKLIPETNTVIPQIEGISYTVNMPANLLAFAINIYGLTSASVNSYKVVVENAGWRVENAGTNDYLAYSPDEKVKINFYYDSYSYFNIDVFPYIPPVEGWPVDAIDAVLTAMGVTGEILPYTGPNNGFEVNEDCFPPAVYVFVDEGTQDASAAAYNQMLLDNGYEVVGTMFGEEIYGKNGDTVAYHAAYLAGACFTIEIFKLSEINPL